MSDQFYFLPFLFLLTFCAPEPTPAPEPQIFSNLFAYDTLQHCTAFDTVPTLSSAPIDLLEASGAVQSTLGPHLAWMINDSGNPPDLFLIDTRTGRLVHTLRFTAVQNTDWEDLAAYTDSQGQTFLYIADIGDNLNARDTVQLLKFTEPKWTELDTLLATQPFAPASLTTLKFTYEDGPRDAEALFVDPLDGELYVINKRTLKNGLHHISFDPNAPTGPATAQKLGEFSLYLCTAADAVQTHTDTTKILARNYDRLLIWTRHRSQTIAEALSAAPKLLPYTHPELQGESIWLTASGAFATVSEEKSNIKAKVAVYHKK